MEKQNNLQSSLNEKDLIQQDRYSDSKSPKNSRSISNSPNNYYGQRKSSDLSGFEQGQREDPKFSSQNFQKQETNPEN